MVTSRYLCAFAVAAAVAVAATPTPRAQQPAPPAGQQLPGPGTPLIVPPPMPEILKQYQPITAAQLKNPADADWPMIRRTYDGWGYSPLSQITTANVARLQPAWVFSTATAR